MSILKSALAHGSATLSCGQAAFPVFSSDRGFLLRHLGSSNELSRVHTDRQYSLTRITVQGSFQAAILVLTSMRCKATSNIEVMGVN